MKNLPSPGGAGQRVLRRRLRVQEGVQGADGFLGHREAGDQGPRLLRGAHHPHHQGGHVAPHSSRSGPAGAVAPHAGRHLEPNQREEARYHAGGAEPRLSDPEMAEIALRNIERRAKHKVTRPEIKVGDMVRIRVKPIESRGSYRVNEIAWSEKVYRVVSAESGEMGARFGLEGWRCTGISEKSPKTLLPNRGVQSRQRRLQRGPRLPPPF